MDQFKNFESNGTVFGSINKNQFKGMKVIIPKQNLINEFDNIVNAIDDKIYNLTKQNQTLSSLRDSLLPKLMSGELRVPPEKVREYELWQVYPERSDTYSNKKIMFTFH